MKKLAQLILVYSTLCLFVPIGSKAAQKQHPLLLLTPKGVTEIKSELKLGNQILKNSFDEIKHDADAAIASGIVVPKPVDLGGGYSHEKHKTNYYDMYHAGIIYQLTGQKKYAEFIRKMLLTYAEMYPTLGIHPAAYTKTPGKLFYQVLNEAVWLNFTANAYDCVYDYINPKERAIIEKNLFRPMADFLENGAKGNYAAFNSMHNFGTWMTSAVGMIGYVMGDNTLVEKALKGSNKDGKTGFLVQLDQLFSPDGYYDEGPGYQRYAIFPFITFAEVINNNEPKRNIFNYRDAVLLKSVNALLQCSYAGDIFRMNDAVEKDIHTFEIIYSTDIAYKANLKNTGLLSIVQQQRKVTLSDAGLAAAKNIRLKKTTPFNFHSTMLRCGIDGTQGGLGILRQPKNNTCVTLKATTLGGGHGHFDRLSLAFFANQSPIFPDYGSARFINIDAKAKGGYAEENKSFAVQTIAHNALVVDSTSNFAMNSTKALSVNPTINFSDLSVPNIQGMSATDTNAFRGVKMQRTVFLITNKTFDFPIVVDLVKANSKTNHQYDLPFYYNGHIINLNIPYQKFADNITKLGSNFGYQHLWKEATFSPSDQATQLNWFLGNQFYTLTTNATSKLNGFLVRTGASDPDYNLVQRAGILYRTRANNVTFASVIEPHGEYNLVKEITTKPNTNIADVTIAVDNDNFTVVIIKTKSGQVFTLFVANQKFGSSIERTVNLNGKEYKWKGNFHLISE
jgi:hypothetical protein